MRLDHSEGQGSGNSNRANSYHWIVHIERLERRAAVMVVNIC